MKQIIRIKGVNFSREELEQALKDFDAKVAEALEPGTIVQSKFHDAKYIVVTGALRELLKQRYSSLMPAEPCVHLTDGANTWSISVRAFVERHTVVGKI